MRIRQCAGGIVVNARGEIVVVGNDLPDNPKTVMPKGGLHEGESWLDAAKREVHEETGIPRVDVDLGFVEYLGMLVRKGLTAEKTDEPSVEKHIEMGLFVVRREIKLCRPAADTATGAWWVPLDVAIREPSGTLSHGLPLSDSLSWPQERAFVAEHNEIILRAARQGAI